MRPLEAAPQKMEPTARLDARFRGAGEKTYLSSCLVMTPLKIAKTFALKTGVGVCVMDSSPGLLAGDFYRTDWHLEGNSRVAVSTQGFTRVHPSRDNPCRSNQSFRLESGARLEWFPEPLMLYKEAAFHGQTEVELAADATLLMGEVVCAGRIARGETFQFHAFQSRLRVRREGRLIYVSQTALRPSQFEPKRIGAWGNWTHQGQFSMFSPQANKSILLQIRT